MGGAAGAAVVTDKYLVRGGSSSRPVLPITITMAESDVVNPKARNEWENPQQRKLDKRMKRRATFLNKLSVRHEADTNAKVIAQKKKNPPALVGDLTELQAALALSEASNTHKSKVAAARARRKAKARSMDGAEVAAAREAEKPAVKTFKGRSHALAIESVQLKAVLEHPQFKINAAATIKDHVKNMLAAEALAHAATKKPAQPNGAGKKKKYGGKTKAAAAVGSARERGKGGSGGGGGVAAGPKKKMGKIGKGGRMSKKK